MGNGLVTGDKRPRHSLLNFYFLYDSITDTKGYFYFKHSSLKEHYIVSTGLDSIFTKKKMLEGEYIKDIGTYTVLLFPPAILFFICQR